MNKFYESIAGVLEVDDVRPETRFRETEGWSSLMAFGILVAMDNEWGATLTVDELLKCETARDLFLQAFASFAARLLGISRKEALAASHGSIPQWDSVNHLRLVMEAESQFGVTYPLERIPSIKTVADFVDAAE